MIPLIIFLEIFCSLLAMDSTEVEECYKQQKSLEEEEKLLEREPGEEDDSVPPRTDLLDVSMEEPPQDQERAITTVTDPIRGAEGSVTHIILTISNPVEGEMPVGAGAGTGSISGAGTGTSTNTGTPEEIVNRNSGTAPENNANSNGSAVSNPTANSNRSATSNKKSLYLATKKAAGTTTLPNLFGEGGGGCDTGNWIIAFGWG
jgi:hypothetical protein